MATTIRGIRHVCILWDNGLAWHCHRIGLALSHSDAPVYHWLGGVILDAQNKLQQPPLSDSVAVCFDDLHTGTRQFKCRRKAGQDIKRLQSPPSLIFKWQFLCACFWSFTRTLALQNGIPIGCRDESPNSCFRQKKTCRLLRRNLSAGSSRPLIVAWGGILIRFGGNPGPTLQTHPEARIYQPPSHFHIFNSVTFQIGTFPYMMIGASVLFFPPATDTERCLEYVNPR